MMPWAKEEILFEWSCPKEVSDASAKADARRVLVFYTKVLFVTAIIWTLIYLTCDYLFPRNCGINLVKLFIVGFVFAIAVLPIEYLSVLVSKLSRIKCRVTLSSMYIGNQIIIRWKDIIGYKVFDYENLKGFACLQLFYRNGRFSRTICLPQNEQAKNIINYISQRVLLYEKLSSNFEIIKLKAGQKVFLYIFIIAYSAVLSWFIVLYEALWLGKIFLAVLVLGPGSIYFPVIFRKRFFKNRYLISMAFLCNSIAGILTTLFTIFLWLYHLKQTIHDW